MPHHPHAHAGAYNHHEPPGGYGDESDELTPESGSEGSELTLPAGPGRPPAGAGGPQVQERAYWDGILMHNAHLRQENMTLRAQVQDLSVGVQ